MNEAATGLQSITDFCRNTDIGFSRVANSDRDFICDECAVWAQSGELCYRVMKSSRSCNAARPPKYGTERS
jgi:hypothetical protein